jgi:peptidoglycan/LPS O-acetylase OafA/YrhL
MMIAKFLSSVVSFLFSRSSIQNPVSELKTQGVRKREIDGYRAIAVILVILSHLDIRFIPGQTGVLFFFVISGYVITGSILREYAKTDKFSLVNFFRRRALKIIPPFAFIILLPSIVMINDLNAKAVSSQIFFLYNWQSLKSSTIGILPGSQVVWSLSVEEQYYIFIALVVALLMNFSKPNFVKHLTLVYSLIFLYSFLSRVFLYFNSDSHNPFGDVPRILYGTDTRMSAIAIGGLVAIYLNSSLFLSFHLKFFRDRKKFVHGVLITLTLLSVFYREEFFRNTFKYALQELVCATLIIIVSNASLNYRFFVILLQGKLFHLIGLASYSIYLSHLVIIIYFRQSYLKNFDTLQLIETISIFCIVIFLGILLHVMVDRPFEVMRNKFR